MIRACGISKRHGLAQVLRGITFEVAQGATLVVRGPSGSGKTTLLRILAGLETPDEGEVYLDGVLASGPGCLTPPHQRGIGFVFQRSALWPHLTVARNILFGVAGLSRNGQRELLSDLLERAGLAGLEGRYPHQLSGGEARRVAILRALAPKPRRLLLDEPLTSLDPERKRATLGLILECAAAIRATLIFVTHDRAEAEQVGGRILEIVDGMAPSENTTAP
jgi:ABC-type sulfate/molybdate transport systems ATPase subunit